MKSIQMMECTIEFYLVGYSLPVSSCLTFEFVTKKLTSASELMATSLVSWLRQSISRAEPSLAITCKGAAVVF